VGVALALERRAAQLAQIAARIGANGRIPALNQGEKMQLGIFFREERAITQQFERWMLPAARGSRESRLDRLIPRLAALHRNLLANSQAAELMLAQELTDVARYSARRP
jgi:DNA polymerase-3 subunit delta